ncbi:P-loop containing nucleoside triphosphate hydrolase protein [Usnea florida]
MTSYLQNDQKQDEFGDIDDEDLLLAEASNQSLKRSFDSDDRSPSKRSRTTENGSASTSLARKILKDTWGFPEFKHKQEQAITRLIDGGSAVVVFPTGGGKSLVYQIPALAFDYHDELCGGIRKGGVTLVVSPLIALMKDQVDALRKRGVCCAAMDSSQTRDAWLDTCDKLRRGQLKLLYVAPERLNNEGFIEMINATKVRLIAIDEAHCISEWGHAFRPDYLKVARFAKEVQAERILCLTATATEKVAGDICTSFDIDPAAVFRTTTYRQNLRLLAQSFESAKEKERALSTFLEKHKGPSIVYVQTHDQTDTVTASLKRAGFNAYGYHAGMTSDARIKVQDRFMASDNIVIVATIAFGMGIDKSNIRNIVHYAVPKSIEGYSQEIGRAGRDGLASVCMIYLCAEDIKIMEEWSRADVPSLRSVNGLVGEFLELYKFAKAGDVIERNLNDESKEWDIRKTALDLLNAQLELRFGLIRAITPKYSEYKYIKCPSFETLTAADLSSPVTKALKKASKTAHKYTRVDVDAVASVGRFPRADAVRKLQEWNDSGAIELHPSGVVNRFRVLGEFPRDEEAKGQMIRSLYAEIENRERSDMQRVWRVIELFATGHGCLSRELARHFADEDTVPDEGCGHCNSCLGNAPKIVFQRDRAGNRPLDENKVQAILSATKVRDDARFLARVAFGISSPRVTAEKLGKNAVFGSMSVDGCAFEDLLKRFEKECHDL